MCKQCCDFDEVSDEFYLFVQTTLARSLARSFFSFSGQGVLCTSFLEFRGLA